jgi:hypothetical protein
MPFEHVAERLAAADIQPVVFTVESDGARRALARVGPGVLQALPPCLEPRRVSAHQQERERLVLGVGGVTRCRRVAQLVARLLDVVERLDLHDQERAVRALVLVPEFENAVDPDLLARRLMEKMSARLPEQQRGEVKPTAADRRRVGHLLAVVRSALIHRRSGYADRLDPARPVTHLPTALLLSMEAVA